MSKLKIPAMLLVIGTMSLGVPAIAAPVTSTMATPLDTIQAAIPTVVGAART
jgi:hypothetical protein